MQVDISVLSNRFRLYNSYAQQTGVREVDSAAGVQNDCQNASDTIILHTSGSFHPSNPSSPNITII